VHKDRINVCHKINAGGEKSVYGGKKSVYGKGEGIRDIGEIWVEGL
jgi:hypothetical protein